jgi:hypothetical protein
LARLLLYTDDDSLKASERDTKPGTQFTNAIKILTPNVTGIVNG